MKITILRGIHNIDMVPEVVSYALSSDVIFVELMGSRQSKSDFMTFSNRLAFEPTFADSEEAKRVMATKEAYTSIMWELRGKGKVLVPVDRVIDESEYKTYALKSTNHVPGAALGAYVKDGSVDNLYAAVEGRIRSAAEEIQARDRLVSQQVQKTLQDMQDRKLVADTILLVQGVLHATKPWLAKLFPTAEIVEAVYNKPLLDELLEETTFQMMLQHLSNTERAIDRDTLSKTIYVDVAMRLQDVGQTSMYSTVENESDRKVERQEHQLELEAQMFSGPELEQKVLDLLGRYRQKMHPSSGTTAP